MKLDKKRLVSMYQELLNLEYFSDFNQETEMEKDLKLNKFLDIRRIYASYVRWVIYLFKFLLKVTVFSSVSGFFLTSPL